jgi:hypothetical protein
MAFTKRVFTKRAGHAPSLVDLVLPKHPGVLRIYEVWRVKQLSRWTCWSNGPRLQIMGHSVVKQPELLPQIREAVPFQTLSR